MLTYKGTDNKPPHSMKLLDEEKFKELQEAFECSLDIDHEVGPIHTEHSVDEKTTVNNEEDIVRVDKTHYFHYYWTCTDCYNESVATKKTLIRIIKDAQLVSDNRGNDPLVDVLTNMMWKLSEAEKYFDKEG